MGDPRLYQIGVLSALLVYGMAWLDFEITAGRAVLLLGTVLATQALCDRLDARLRPQAASFRLRQGSGGQVGATGSRPINFKSALISGLSLCLLLRTNSPELAVLAARHRHRREVPVPHPRASTCSTPPMARWSRCCC